MNGSDEPLALRRLNLQTADGVAVITLNDPQRRNALDVELCEELIGVFDDLERRDDIGAVVLTGAAPASAAGADISHLETTKVGDTEAGLRAIYAGFLRVSASPLPTVAAVNGPAIGAGMNLALACDLRIAGKSARFETRFLQIGLHPGGGHTWLMRSAIGVQGTIAAVVFGETLSGDDAARTGLVWRCVDDDELLEECWTLARRAASAPNDVVQRAKSTILEIGSVSNHPDAVERELVPQVWSIRQPTFQERLIRLTQALTRSTTAGARL